MYIVQKENSSEMQEKIYWLKQGFGKNNLAWKVIKIKSGSAQNLVNIYSLQIIPFELSFKKVIQSYTITRVKGTMQLEKKIYYSLLCKEVEIAVAAMKRGKSAKIFASRKTIIDVLIEICNKSWRTGEWPILWAQSLFISLPAYSSTELQKHQPVECSLEQAKIPS